MHQRTSGLNSQAIDLSEDMSLFTRTTDPFNPRRVKRLVQLVEVGDNLSASQRSRVEALIAEHADVFAFSVSEVMAADSGAVHTMNVPEGATFSRKIHQRPLKAPEREYFFPWVESMEQAGVIRKIDPKDIKCYAPTILAQKVHDGGGLTLLEIQHRLNDQCNTAGFPQLHLELVEREDPALFRKDEKPKPAKY